MNKIILRFSIGAILSFTSILTLAQGNKEISNEDYLNNNVEMADLFRSEGKIYVVIFVILIIILGLFLYLYRVDRVIKKIEEFNDNTPQSND